MIADDEVLHITQSLDIENASNYKVVLTYQNNFSINSDKCKNNITLPKRLHL